MGDVKEEAMRIVEALDSDATWDDLMYALFVNKKVAEGEDAINEGSVVSHADARKKAAKG